MNPFLLADVRIPPPPPPPPPPDVAVMSAVAGVALALGFAALGVWLARRRAAVGSRT